MSSEEDVEKMQKILAASVILIALSLGIGGFETFKTWYQLDIDSTEEDYDGDVTEGDFTLKFHHEGFDYEADTTTTYSYDGEVYSDSYSDDIDYGYNEIYENSEDSMKNIQRGGYLVLGLILFVIWKLQEIKTESSEEVRSEIIEQIDKVMKGTGALIVLISLYFIFGGSMEEDFDDFIVGSTDSDGYYGNFFSVDCAEGWVNEPKFEWIGKDNARWDDSVCTDNSYWYVGEAKIENSLKIGFFSFVGSLAPLYFVFSSISLNPNLGSFSVPSVPDIQNQRQDMKLKSPFKEKEIDAYNSNNQTVYNQPEISRMAIPEDEED